MMSRKGFPSPFAKPRGVPFGKGYATPHWRRPGQYLTAISILSSGTPTLPIFSALAPPSHLHLFRGDFHEELFCVSR